MLARKTTPQGEIIEKPFALKTYRQKDRQRDLQGSYTRTQKEKSGDTRKRWFKRA